MSALHAVCPRCHAVNRIPAERLEQDPKCGKCGHAVLDGHPVALGTERFQDFIANNDLPVVVDFWADWCGPCKTMAPVFARVAREMKTRFRFAKVDTEAEPTLGYHFGIRGIPALLVFRGGQEVARTAGAMDSATLRRWLEQV